MGEKRKKKVVSPKDYLDGLKKLQKKDEDEFAFYGDDFLESEVLERVPTGSLGVDRLLGGGWPVGRLCELAAWEGVGKSTIIDQSIAACQRVGGVAILIETEGARDRAYMHRLGIDVDSLIWRPADTIEDAFAMLDKALDLQEAMAARKDVEEPLVFLAWDSVGGTPTEQERDAASDEATVGSAAKVLKRNFRRTIGRIAKLRIAAVVANHFYEGIGPFASLKTYGGGAIRFFTSARVWLSRKGTLKSFGDQDVGHLVEAKMRKTRLSVPPTPEEVALVWGIGVDDAYTLFEWGQSHGVPEQDPPHVWVKRQGQWNYLMTEPGNEKAYEAFQGGFIGLRGALEKYPAVRAAMVEQYRRGG